MRIIFGFYLTLYSITTFGQSIYTVKDSVTNEPIPYVNIWTEKEMKGTTSNKKGEFYLDKIQDKFIIFSSIGYETKRIYWKAPTSTILLIPDTVKLSEIVIKGSNKEKLTQIDEIEKSSINAFFGCSGYPYMVGKYFPYKDSYYETPYLGKIEVLTDSDIKDSQFNIRLYTMNSDGIPEKLIYGENIIVNSKRGTHITTVDLVDRLIEIPESGVLIAIEFLIIESNKYNYVKTKSQTKEKTERTSYEPAIGTIPRESNENSWIYTKGEWNKTSKYANKLPDYEDKYTEVAIKLTLTN